MNFKASVIAEFLKGEIVGNPDAEVNNVSKIEDGQPGTIAFLGNPKYEKYVYETRATILLVNKDFKPEKEISPTLIKVDNAYESFASLLELYQQGKPQKTGIRPLSSIDESVKIGENVYVGEYSVIEQGAKIGNNVKIYPQVYIGDGVEIGEGSILYPGVKVYEGCKIGRNCVFHSGTIIGADGFGFAPSANNDYKKIPQIGIVIIEDFVEIGANCCVDRATMGATIIRKGVKLDNLIQVAHNVEIGENTVMAAQTGIAGSAKIGKNNMFGGQVAINGHIKIGDNVKIGAQSGVLSDVKDGEMLQGSSAIPFKNFWKSHVIFTKLPEMRQQLNQLEREFKDLKKSMP
ncbi:MAG: UDP-3-O-(3-hydroxymyristoyl)glucosamine N-acyltransferase [Bacteroidales bacterium]|nr:UDP-3-O-(3-hydroxymyristoyl)glucosamine N-acyltransferase [Bacteroidales bacterium]MCF8390655.1 UDP-3-O-(3-hydroxymyristoyl)glucosamine N-acyltransferase [Bacteroidales bacterium]